MWKIVTLNLKLSQINWNRSISEAYIALDCFQILLNVELSEGTAIVEPLRHHFGCSNICYITLTKILIIDILMLTTRSMTSKMNLKGNQLLPIKKKVNHTARRILRIGILFSLIFIACFVFPFYEEVLLVSFYAEIPFFLSF